MDKQDSLLTAYILDGKAGGRAISWEEVDSWQPGEGVLWIHLNYAGRDAQAWLNQQIGIDSILSEVMTSDESRPRCLLNDKSVILILRAINLNPGEDPEDMVSLRIYFDRNRIITMRKRSLFSISQMQTKIEEGNGPKTSAEFVVLLNEMLVKRMEDIVSDIDDDVDSMDEELTYSDSILLRTKIADIRHQTILIRRYLLPQSQAISILKSDENILFNHAEKERIREVNNTLTRCVENLEVSRERARVCYEELSNRLSEQMNQRMFALSIVSILFLPVTFLTGLFGINVGGIPGAHHQGAFKIICLVLGLIIFVTLFLLKRKKWV